MAAWTVACQPPLSMGFPRQEYRGGLPFPFPGDLSDPGIESTSPALAGRFFILVHQGSPANDILVIIILGNHPILPTHAKKQLTHTEKQLFHFYRDCRKSEKRWKQATFAISTRLIEMCSLYILKFTPEYRKLEGRKRSELFSMKYLRLVFPNISKKTVHEKILISWDALKKIAFN